MRAVWLAGICPTELAMLADAGYVVSRCHGGWSLSNETTQSGWLSIGDRGCIAPTWLDAAAEGLKRAAADLA